MYARYPEIRTRQVDEQNLRLSHGVVRTAVVRRYRELAELDYSCRPLESVRARPPVLMLPSREQNYSHPYFWQVFPKAVRLLRESTVLVLVGYSFPEDDALIRFVLRQLAEEAEDGRAKCIFYVDPSTKARKRKAIVGVFPGNEADMSVSVVPYQGTFGDFAAQCVAAGDWKGEY